MLVLLVLMMLVLVMLVLFHMRRRCQKDTLRPSGLGMRLLRLGRRR